MKSNLTKEFYILIRESTDDDLTNWTENFIDSHSCYDLREYLIKYREAVKNKTFTLSNEEMADLNRSIESEDCRVWEIQKKGGLKCCYDQKTKKENTFICNMAKDEMKNQLKEKIKSDSKRVALQMCWFNENIIKDPKVTFCKPQTNSNTITTNKTEVPTNTKVDSPVNTTTQNKTEISTPKKEQPKVTDADLKGWDKFPCLKNYTTKKASTENGDYTYKVKAYGDHTEYYYLDGTMKIKDEKGNITTDYFEC